MKQVKFKSVRVEGFRSFVTAEHFDYERPGINLIKGKNGSGKSTLLEALVWGLYGENLKGTVKEKLISKKEYRPKDFRGTRVIINLEVSDTSYTIARHIKYKDETLGYKGESKLMVFEEGKLRGAELYNGDSDQFIQNDILGVDFKTFMNSVVFGQRMKRLVEAKPTEKRELFEKLFDLDFIEAAKAKAKEKKTLAESKLAKVNQELATEEALLQSNINKLEADTNTVNGFAADKQQKIDVQQKLIDDIRDKIKAEEEARTPKIKRGEELMIEIEAIGDNSVEVSKIQNAIDSIELEIQPITEELDRLGRLSHDYGLDVKGYDREMNNALKTIEVCKTNLANVSTECSTCGAPLSADGIKKSKATITDKIKAEEGVIEELKKKVKQITDVDLPGIEQEADHQMSLMNTKQQEIDELNEKLNNLPDLEGQKRELQGRVNSIDNAIIAHNNNITQYKREIEMRDENIKNIEATELKGIDLEATEEAIEINKNNIDEIQSDIVFLNTVLEKINWWVTKGFGSSGIKSYVFFAMLNDLNKSILKYCDRLGVMVQFSVDMTKASKPFLTRCFKSDGTEITYNELSGGEKARIDIATAFAFYDLIASSKTKFNCIFLDETFAGLDEEGLYQAFDLLRTISEDGKCVYVITHNQAIDMLNTKTVEIVKEKGVSRVL